MTPLSPEDLDFIIRTVFGEAAGEDPRGQQAVAAVIMNRAQERGMSPKDVALQPHQFEPWDARSAELLALDPAGAAYSTVAQNIDPFLSGQAPSPVGGADHFFAPGLQADLGRSVPSWAQGQQGTQLGAHTFYDLGRVGGPVPRSHRLLIRPSQALRSRRVK